jgi:hypothetical protein
MHQECGISTAKDAKDTKNGDVSLLKVTAVPPS